MPEQRTYRGRRPSVESDFPKQYAAKDCDGCNAQHVNGNAEQVERRVAQHTIRVQEELTRLGLENPRAVTRNCLRCQQETNKSPSSLKRDGWVQEDDDWVCKACKQKEQEQRAKEQTRAKRRKTC